MCSTACGPEGHAGVRDQLPRAERSAGCDAWADYMLSCSCRFIRKASESVRDAQVSSELNDCHCVLLGLERQCYGGQTAGGTGTPNFFRACAQVEWNLRRGLDEAAAQSARPQPHGGCLVFRARVAAAAVALGGPTVVFHCMRPCCQTRAESARETVHRQVRRVGSCSACRVGYRACSPESVVLAGVGGHQQWRRSSRGSGGSFARCRSLAEAARAPAAVSLSLSLCCDCVMPSRSSSVVALQEAHQHADVVPCPAVVTGASHERFWGGPRSVFGASAPFRPEDSPQARQCCMWNHDMGCSELRNISNHGGCCRRFPSTAGMLRAGSQELPTFATSCRGTSFPWLSIGESASVCVCRPLPLRAEGLLFRGFPLKNLRVCVSVA